MKQKKNRQENTTGQKSLLKMQFSSTVLFILLIIIIYILFKYSDGNGKDAGNSPVEFSSEFCSIVRPPGWTGGRIKNSFVFKNPSGDFTVSLQVFKSRDFLFTGLNKDEKYLEETVWNRAAELDLHPKNIKIQHVKIDNFNFVIPEINLVFSSDNYFGRAALFYSNDARFLYIALWKNNTGHNRYIARVFMQYVTLLPPYDTPLYKRPVITPGENSDPAALMKEFDLKTREAMALWRNTDEAPDNVLNAMKNFQAAMVLLAESGMGSGFSSEYEKIIEVYKKCREYRKQRLNKMKSEVIQAETLGNKALAKEIAKELAEMASLDDENSIREWAEKRLGNNGDN